MAQFVNGEMLDDGTVSDALLIQPLSNARGAVKKAVEGLEYKKGFTTMAQAFDLAEKVFLLGGRKKAMSAVLTLTDGTTLIPLPDQREGATAQGQARETLLRASHRVCGRRAQGHEGVGGQLEVLRTSKARFIMKLNEATASLNAGSSGPSPCA